MSLSISRRYGRFRFASYDIIYLPTCLPTYLHACMLTYICVLRGVLVHVQTLDFHYYIFQSNIF